MYGKPTKVAFYYLYHDLQPWHNVLYFLISQNNIHRCIEYTSCNYSIEYEIYTHDDITHIFFYTNGIEH